MKSEPRQKDRKRFEIGDIRKMHLFEGTDFGKIHWVSKMIGKVELKHCNYSHIMFLLSFS
jgi:hypothetical protein